ncbi:MAG TPA: TIGR04282 family arsenosugar biosynthesis glycosyltransferase [Thermoanaerobaculia bacterium]|nr:TIGR04282 family arsenosugar biosynthesis glycosyltransferase [Thermoanaerobaculia bacterium]
MPQGRPALLLFARAPVEGKVKTRLVPPLTVPSALRLYQAFLEDAARIYRAPGLWEAVLEAEPGPEHPELVRLFTPPWRLEAQRAGDLGQRLEDAFARAFARGASAAVAVGSDHPALPRARIEESFRCLSEGIGATLIPADDGGYCAVGLCAQAPLAEVFREIPWSTPSALKVTQQRMQQAGLSVSVLPASYDIDQPEDLARLRDDLFSRDARASDYPACTARALAEILA